ncbi:MAG TPA: zinc ribbon domain-containing protein [Bacillota bacterium]|nr:zinc ribbon domain-containing protein [Bacillota bacterium]
MALKKCKSCGNDIDDSARRCPHCGAYLWTGGRIGCAIVLIIIFLPMFYTCFGNYFNYPFKDYSKEISKSSSDEVTSPVPNSTSSISQPTSPVPQQTQKHWVTVIEDSGHVSKNTDIFTLHGGKVKLTYSFGGEDPYGYIYVLPEGHIFEEQGGLWDVTAKKATNETTFLVKKAGNYYLKIMSDNWEIKLEEEISEPPLESKKDVEKKQDESLPVIATFSGSGSLNTKPFTTTGPWEIQWDSRSDYFYISLFTENGERVGPIAAQPRAGVGSSYQPRAGSYYLKVISIGDWTIKIVKY